MIQVTDAMVERLWSAISGLCGDLSDVPAEEIMRRPRHQGIPPILRHALTYALSAAPDPWRPIETPAVQTLPQLPLDSPGG